MRMNGLETFRAMRRIRDDAQIILTSGYTEEDASERFGEPGLAGFLQKPYRLRELRSTLEAVMRPASEAV